MDLEAAHAIGLLSCSFFAAAVATTAACGLSSYCSSAADAATTVHLTTADVAAAANPVKNCLN